MQVTVEQLSENTYCIKVMLPHENIDKHEQEKLRELAKEVHLRGFRKGRSPLHIIQQRFGDNLRSEVVNEAIKDSFQKAVSEQELRIIGQPKIENLKAERGEDLSYQAICDVFPKIELQNYSVYEIEQPEAEVEESDIDTTIERLRKSKTVWEQKQAPAALDDRVTFRYRATVDGKLVDENEGDVVLVLGSGPSPYNVETALIGMSAGEKKAVDYSFPEQATEDDLSGKTAVIEVELVQVEAGELPEIDETFLKSYQMEGGLDEFRLAVKRTMQRELSWALKKRLRDNVVKALVSSHKIEVPQALMEHSGDEELNYSEDIKKVYAEQRRHLIAGQLIIRAIAEQERIEVEMEQVKASIRSRFSNVPDGEVEQHYLNNQQLLNEVTQEILEDRVIEFITRQAQLTQVRLTYSEVVNR